MPDKIVEYTLTMTREEVVAFRELIDVEEGCGNCVSCAACGANHHQHMAVRERLYRELGMLLEAK